MLAGSRSVFSRRRDGASPHHHAAASAGRRFSSRALPQRRKRPMDLSPVGLRIDPGPTPLDALEDVCASHPDHAAIRADVCRDPSRDDRRRANEPSSPDRRYSAICRPISRRLEYDPRTLDASYDVIGDRRTWTHRAAQEHPGEIPRGVHCQNLQQGATLALPNRGDEALGRSRNSGCDKKKQSGDDAIHALLQVGLAAIGRQWLNDRSQLSRQAPNLHFEASLEAGIFSMRRA
jgi:hypothetical protein